MENYDKGITRISITDGWNGRGFKRLTDSRDRWMMANHLYRYIFAQLNMPLLDGYNEIKCTKEEYEAGYDFDLGIDVILAFDNGMKVTMQEKFLYTNFGTVTVEYMNNPDSGEVGDWFTGKWNWYFVGYDTDKKMRWNEWALVDWPAMMRLTMQNRIVWYENKNQNDGARASFKYTYISRLPKECVIASSHSQSFANYPRSLSSAGQLSLF